MVWAVEFLDKKDAICYTGISMWKESYKNEEIFCNPWASHFGIDWLFAIPNKENYERMSASLGDVVSGSVTTAVRDTTIDGLEIHENDNLGMVDGKIVVSNPDMMETLEETFAHMLDEDSEIVTIYVGEDGSEEMANELAQALAEKYEDVEVEIHQGGQPVYPYLFSVE